MEKEIEHVSEDIAILLIYIYFLKNYFLIYHIPTTFPLPFLLPALLPISLSSTSPPFPSGKDNSFRGLKQTWDIKLQ